MPTDINTGQHSLHGIGNRSITHGKATEPTSNSPTAGASADDASPKATDSVSISHSGQKLQALETSIRSEPHVRVEVVREIQKRVQNGDFPIDVETLAQQIIEQEDFF